MNTYKAVIRDYTGDHRDEIIVIIEQPRQHLDKNFFRNIAGFMWNECYNSNSSRDMYATITKNGSFVASMGCAYLHHYNRVHTTICGRFPSNPCTFRAFNISKEGQK